MDKPADGRGNTGSTDGIKAGGDAGNERHACKANPATTDGIGKKHVCVQLVVAGLVTMIFRV